MVMPLKDLTGKRFGELRVSHRVENLGRATAWECRCSCGATSVVRSADLTRGRQKYAQSCGCKTREAIVRARRRHGMTDTKVHHIWHGMRQRCQNPSAPAYPRYGGRGIKVCDRWQVFEDFVADMGHPTAEQSIDRIDNDGDYEHGNCRWATAKEQANNRTTNHRIEHDGRSLTISQWARETGIKEAVISARISKGWPVDKMLTKPMYTPQKHRFRGRAQTISEWASEMGILRGMIDARVHRGWSLEQAVFEPVRGSRWP